MTELAHLEVERLGALCLVRVFGEIDMSNGRDLSSAIEEAVPNEALGLIVDLTHTTYLDSAGIQVLFVLAERLRARRQEFTVVVPTDAPTRAVIELTGLPKVMALQERLGEAHRNGP